MNDHAAAPAALDHATLWRISREIPGWLLRKEGVLLYELAHAAGQGVIVELGCYQGRSTVWLVAGRRTNPHNPALYVVDSFVGSGPTEPNPKDYQADIEAAFRTNLTRLGLIDELTVLRGWHAEAGAAWTGGRISLLFLDGDHSYAGTRRAFEAWNTHLAPGSIVAFHDVRSYYPGVVRYWDELCRGPLRHQGRAGSIAWGLWLPDQQGGTGHV